MDTGLVALVLGQFALLGWVLWLVLPLFLEKSRRRVELQSKVLERFGSAQEFVDFLDTEAGRRFQDSLSGRRSAPQARILMAVQAGLVLVALGVALFFVAGGVDRPILLVWAAVTTALGVGSLASAWVSYGLSKAWGLLSPPKEDPSLKA